MVIAFCLYKYFPFGGLQRDFLRIALTVASRGHHVRVYTQSWQGNIPDNLDIVIVPVKSCSNHGKNSEYYRWVCKHLENNPVDRVVGFNKMPGLDVYYAADVCYAEKVSQEKGFFYRLTPRYRHYASFEKATFVEGKSTQLLMLTDKQIADFQKHYHTENQRFHILPPGIYPDRKYSAQVQNCRVSFRKENNISDTQYLIIQIGSDFSRKGVDRTIKAIASLPEPIRKQTMLFVVGQDKADRYVKLAKEYNVAGSIKFFPGRNDVSELMAAADLLIHPAYQEAAGIVLVEAIAAGLPVITTAVCGYAHYVKEADCGIVIDEPFEQNSLNEAVYFALSNSGQRNTWRENAQLFADTQDIYSLPEKAADLIIGGNHG
ncbi:glycosyltransferase family 4 protein [Citrobacter sp. C348]|uniref:glycosyltransferase family 4 protein n=1 Tax=Citrobacter sp. C348 TaxID=3048143 RepID=UPI0015E93A2C|nr:glycosyltransferase family 4 protein [Citrobacter freundii]MBA7803837.1 glycosyltransferase family 4 protein [Citrobacter freundii]QMD23093.1 glycosyltransferase family 4 protein [Citrobacter freundii]WFW13300.1 glycosyltransferase family 4 protein [Citrobacter freundii]